MEQDLIGFPDKMNGIRKYVGLNALKEAKWDNSIIIEGNLNEEITQLKNEKAKFIYFVQPP